VLLREVQPSRSCGKDFYAKEACRTEGEEEGEFSWLSSVQQLLLFHTHCQV